MTKFDFDDRPFVVIWAVTRACSLACRHCRAEATWKMALGALLTAGGIVLLTAK